VQRIPRASSASCHALAQPHADIAVNQTARALPALSFRPKSEKLEAAVAGIAHEARLVTIAAREMDLERDLRPDLCYRLEQWDADSLARTISACSSLYIAIAGWQEAVKLDPRSTWVLRQGAHVLKEHKPS
jgi:hypothetical protein